MTADDSPAHVRAVDSVPNDRGCVQWCPACERVADGSPAVAPEDVIRRALTHSDGDPDEIDAAEAALAALVAERDAPQERAEAASVSAWLIERPSGQPGRPHYWMDTVGGYGLGNWTQDPWTATRYATEGEANHAISRWVAHPTVTDAKAVSHGFIGAVEMENARLQAERDSARREREQAVDALRKIAAHPHGGILVNIARRALVELGESKQ